LIISTKKILDGIVTFNNEFPISLLVSDPVPFLEIRELQTRYSEALGYPVVIMDGELTDDGYKMSLYHRDSVLSANEHYYQLNFSCSSLSVIGLWNGESITNLAKLILENEKTREGRFPYKYIALKSRKLSKADLSTVRIGIKESMEINYFRDKSNCGLVLDNSRRYWERKLILSPSLDLLRLSMLLSSVSRYKISNVIEVETKVKAGCIGLYFDSELTELDQEIVEFNNAISIG
jgi:hypothetical protein